MVSRASEAPAHKPLYRTVIPLPEAFATNLYISFEELFDHALTVFGDVTLSGASHPNRLQLPTYKPNPILIEVLSTVLVHPRYTTRATPENIQHPSRSIYLLRGILSSIGPLNADLDQAFSLKAPEGRYTRNGIDLDEEDINIQKILGAKGRLKECAKDFWQIVGWAFNCSVVHPKRWKHWKIWLDFMLDVLDEDWEERTRLDEEDAEISLSGDRKEPKTTRRKKSLIVQYLSEVNGRSHAMKRVVGSAFTDGGEFDLRMFPEVYPNETTYGPPKAKKNKAKVNDYKGFEDLDEDEDEDDRGLDEPSMADEEPPSSQTSQSTEGGESGPDPWLGGTESIILRQRVLTQLSRVAFFVPECFVSLKDLYECFTLNIRQLPTPAFSLLMSGADSSTLPTEVYVSLIQLTLLRYLPPNAPSPRTISNASRVGDEMDQEVIEKCYLPFCASTSSTEDNAKLSILAENVFRFLVKSSVLVLGTTNLRAAVEKGIKARESKIKGENRRGPSAAKKIVDTQDMMWLKASGQRMMCLLAFVEHGGS